MGTISTVVNDGRIRIPSAFVFNYWPKLKTHSTLEGEICFEFPINFQIYLRYEEVDRAILVTLGSNTALKFKDEDILVIKYSLDRPNVLQVLFMYNRTRMEMLDIQRDRTFNRFIAQLPLEFRNHVETISENTDDDNAVFRILAMLLGRKEEEYDSVRRDLFNALHTNSEFRSLEIFAHLEKPEDWIMVPEDWMINNVASLACNAFRRPFIQLSIDKCLIFYPKGHSDITQAVCYAYVSPGSFVKVKLKQGHPIPTVHVAENGGDHENVYGNGGHDNDYGNGSQDNDSGVEQPQVEVEQPQVEQPQVEVDQPQVEVEVDQPQVEVDQPQVEVEQPQAPGPRDHLRRKAGLPLKFSAFKMFGCGTSVQKIWKNRRRHAQPQQVLEGGNGAQQVVQVEHPQVQVELPEAVQVEQPQQTQSDSTNGSTQQSQNQSEPQGFLVEPVPQGILVGSSVLGEQPQQTQSFSTNGSTQQIENEPLRVEVPIDEQSLNEQIVAEESGETCMSGPTIEERRATIIAMLRHDYIEGSKAMKSNATKAKEIIKMLKTF